MPTLSDVKPVAQALRDLTPGAPVAHGALTVISLLAGERDEPGGLTLAEADEAVTIEEVSEGGDVPTPRLTIPVSCVEQDRWAYKSARTGAPP